MNQIQKVRSIGYKLLQGPRSILPPGKNHDWLEKDLSIYMNYIGDARVQHISLWSDSTVNKESNFLNPIIRFAHWERSNDLEKSRSIQWPDVRVLLGYIKDDCFSELNRAIIAFQELIPAITFKPLGISLARDVAEVKTADSHINYEIYIRNGVQSIAYFSPILDQDKFSNEAVALKYLLLQSMTQFDPIGWKERYNSTFDEAPFDWDYKEPESNIPL